ncbi:unknown [Prevotella sp. CAG:617]|nr:unknown [Prevotella sp. CAG:617]
MSNNQRVVRRRRQHHHAGHHRPLVHPEGRLRAVRRNHQLVPREPQPHRLGQQQHQSRHRVVYAHHAAELPLQVRLVAAPQRKRDKPRRSAAQRPLDKSEQGHHAAHHVIHAVVRHAQRLQYQAPRQQGHQHHQHHPHVQHHRVARQSPASRCSFRSIHVFVLFFHFVLPPLPPGPAAVLFEN